MNRSSNQWQMPRRLAVLLLSKERGRAPEHPLDPSLISKWCADLGFGLRQGYFTPDEYRQLQAVNQHYASGGNRPELLQKLGKIKNGSNH